MNADGVRPQQNPPTYVGGSPVATRFASYRAENSSFRFTSRFM
ncbi:MAG: hypothetical protein ACRCUY_04135 [Thermoguttaceae bacterium]